MGRSRGHATAADRWPVDAAARRLEPFEWQESTAKRVVAEAVTLQGTAANQRGRESRRHVTEAKARG